MKPRFYAFVFIIFLLFIIVIAAIGGGNRNTGSTQSQRGDPTMSVKIDAEAIGLSFVVVVNENTGATLHLQPQNLPWTLNFAKGDILTFKVYSKENYIFNAWALSDGEVASFNPWTLRPARSFSMTAMFMNYNLGGNSGGN